MAKLMLVEDDNNLREIYEARLQAEGYEIISAKDGEEALVLAKSETPDLIIADIMMPKISGFEMLDILRNTDGRKDVKVIMLTALGQNDDQQRANQLGADRYLVKSQVTLEDIVKVTHELLSDKEAPTTTTEPVSETPAKPETAPPVATIPVAVEPPDNPSTADPVADGDAQPAAQGEAGADSRIEDFVAGASEEATSPSVAPTASSTPAVQPQPTPASEPASTADDVATAAKAADAANDDKLIADAAQKLVDSTEGKTDETVAATPPAAAAPAKADPETDTPAASDAPDTTETSKSSGAGTPDKPKAEHRERIITPLDDPGGQPKKDLDTLLAIEEAHEAGTAPAAPPIPIVAADNPGAQPATAPPNTVVEPPSAAPVVASTDASDKPSGEAATSAPPPPSSPTDPNSIAL